MHTSDASRAFALRVARPAFLDTRVTTDASHNNGTACVSSYCDMY